MPHLHRLGRGASVHANGSHARFTIGRGLRQQVRSLLRGGRHDLVHMHVPLSPSLPLLALEEAECRVVGTFHTQLGRNRAYALDNAFFQRHMDRLAAAIAASPTDAASCDRYFRSRWTVIPNGIELGEFRTDRPRPSDLPGDPLTLLFLGRLDPRHGLGTLLQALPRVRAESPRVVQRVVGGSPIRSLYQALAHKLPGVHLVGPVLAGRPGFFAHSDIYVCPSTLTSFGIPLLEAMAYGTPIVCSAAAGFRHVVPDGVEACITPIRDAEKLVRAILCPMAGAMVAAAAIGGTLQGIHHRNSPLFGWVLHRPPRRDRRVALTFDDGPKTRATPQVLDTLGAQGVPATSFVLGVAADRSPKRVRRELEAGSDAIQSACGVRPHHFRVPHGFRNPWVSSVARCLRTQGYRFAPLPSP